MLHLHAGLGDDAPQSLVAGAVELFDRAVTDGRAVDGAPGFVYTTDWTGQPVVRQRMHWVLAEAVSAAAAPHQHTGDQRYLDRSETWWDYARRHLVDDELGSWHHELDPENRPAATVCAGRARSVPRRPGDADPPAPADAWSRRRRPRRCRASTQPSCPIAVACCPRDPLPPPGRTHGRAGRPARRSPRKPSGGPVRTGSRRRAGEGRRTLADPTAVAPARDRRPRRRRRCLCRGAVPQPALAGRAAAGEGARRCLGSRPSRLAAARGDRRQPRRGLVRHPCHPSRSRHRRRRGPAPPEPPLLGRPKTGRPVLVVRRAASAARHRLA